MYEPGPGVETFHPHGNTDLFELTEIIQARAQQMVVSHQCRGAVLLKSMQHNPLGTTALGLRRLGALFCNSRWDLGNAAPPRDLGVPQKRRTLPPGHDFQIIGHGRQKASL